MVADLDCVDRIRKGELSMPQAVSLKEDNVVPVLVALGADQQVTRGPRGGVKHSL